jgi:hypothetical protein
MEERLREDITGHGSDTYRLLAIKEKLHQQRQHMEDLDKHMSVPTRYRIYEHG